VEKTNESGPEEEIEITEEMIEAGIAALDVELCGSPAFSRYQLYEMSHQVLKAAMKLCDH
jgi:hypothetical protein